MTIRPALPGDVPALLELGEEFYRVAGCEALGLRFDRDSLIDTMEGIALEGLLQVAEEDDGNVVGCIAAVLLPWYLDKRQTVAQEIWWYVRPEARGGNAGRALLGALEDWAHQQGASLVQMATPGPASQDEAVGRLYRRWGYEYVESAWARKVD